MRTLLLAALATTILSGDVLAQTPAPKPSATPQATPMPAATGWRASKLMGLDIYNAQNEKVGDINEVLIDQSGKVVGIVIGVGGFLGMGEHDVLVKMEDLKFMNEPVRTSSSAPANNTGSSRPAGNTGTTAPTNTPARAANEKWYPDHAVINATKDQLKAMPQFRYN